MTNDELLKLKIQFHIEAEETATAFHIIALRAEPGSEVAKQFKLLADKAFNQAEIYYKASLDAYREINPPKSRERKTGLLTYRHCLAANRRPGASSKNYRNIRVSLSDRSTGEQSIIPRGHIAELDARQGLSIDMQPFIDALRKKEAGEPWYNADMDNVLSARIEFFLAAVEKIKNEF